MSNLNHRGQFFDGVSAASIEAEVTITDKSVRAINPESTLVLFDAPLTDCILEAESSDPYHPGGLRILLKKNTDVQIIIAAYTSIMPKKKLGLSLLKYIALLPVVWLIISNGSNIASKFIAKQIPLRFEKKIGDDLLPLLALQQVTNKEAEGILKTKLLDRLNAARGDAAPFNVILNSDPQINAFALPGGNIIVTCEMIRFMNDGEEFAAVLSHEYQHLIQRHHATHLVRFFFFQSIWHAVIGDFSGLIVADPITLNLLTTMKFNRQDETEADQKGLELLTKAGIHTRGLSTGFERLRQQEEGDFTNSQLFSYFSSHPSFKDRIKIEDLDKKVESPVLTEAEFSQIQDACVSKN